MNTIQQHAIESTSLPMLERIAERFPHHRPEVDRMARLLVPSPPAVVVLGHYNHGKSSLLNALIGEDCFAVSNKRETIKVKIKEHAGIRWVDTPGLDADISGEDDRKALDAANTEADLRLLVHAADLGELDRNETAMVERLIQEQRESDRAFLLALTRTDKVSVSDLDTIVAAIQAQVPEATMIAVSSHLAMRGREENKPQLSALGNLDALQAAISQAETATRTRRACERSRLISDMLDSMAKEKDELLNQLEWLRVSREAKLTVLAPGMMLRMMAFNNDVLMS